jgi:hypothetical protein
VGGRRKKLQRREKGWKEKGEKVTVVALPLVRSWVDGNDGGKVGCGDGSRWQRKQKKKKKPGGAAERREKLTMALGGWLVVSCGGANCGTGGDSVGVAESTVERESEERERDVVKKPREEAGFFF